MLWVFPHAINQFEIVSNVRLLSLLVLKSQYVLIVCLSIALGLWGFEFATLLSLCDGGWWLSCYVCCVTTTNGVTRLLLKSSGSFSFFDWYQSPVWNLKFEAHGLQKNTQYIYIYIFMYHIYITYIYIYILYIYRHVYKPQSVTEDLLDSDTHVYRRGRLI